VVLKLTIARIGALVWVLIYAGLLVCAVGVSMHGTDPDLGKLLAVAGLLLVAVGAALIGVRARMTRARPPRSTSHSEGNR